MNRRRGPLFERREQFGKQYGLSANICRLLSPSFMDQLDNCQSEEARRLLLGISERLSSEQLPSRSPEGSPEG